MATSKFMKGTVVAALTLGLTLSAAACSSSPATTTSPGTGGAATTAGATKISFIQGVIGDSFYVTMQCAIEDEAKKLGVTVTTQGPQKFDATLQVPILQSVVASKPAGILIAPTDVTALQRPLQDASATIKIGLVDTTVNDPSFAVTAVSSDNLGGGKAAFEAIKQLAPNGGKVLVIDNQPGISTSDARVKGFQEAVATDSRYTYVGVQYAQNDTAKAAQIVNAALQKDPDIVGIFATNLFGGTGAATGVRQANAQDKVKIVSFDAGADQVKALRDGTIQALIAQQPGKIGSQALDELVKAINGQATTKNIGTGFTIITKDNVDGDAKDAIYKTTC